MAKRQAYKDTRTGAIRLSTNPPRGAHYERVALTELDAPKADKAEKASDAGKAGG
jgi:hypothetical protein